MDEWIKKFQYIKNKTKENKESHRYREQNSVARDGGLGVGEIGKGVKSLK